MRIHVLSKQHYYLLRCHCCFQTDIQLLNITLKFSVLLLLCKLLGLLCVITGRSDAEPDEPHHSVSYFCQMSLPNISALFHAQLHINIVIQWYVCFFLSSADRGKQTGGAVANRFLSGSCLATAYFTILDINVTFDTVGLGYTFSLWPPSLIGRLVWTHWMWNRLELMMYLIDCISNVSVFAREMECFGKYHLKQIKPSWELMALSLSTDLARSSHRFVLRVIKF